MSSHVLCQVCKQSCPMTCYYAHNALFGCHNPSCPNSRPGRYVGAPLDARSGPQPVPQYGYPGGPHPGYQGYAPPPPNDYHPDSQYYGYPPPGPGAAPAPHNQADYLREWLSDIGRRERASSSGRSAETPPSQSASRGGGGRGSSRPSGSQREERRGRARDQGKDRREAGRGQPSSGRRASRADFPPEIEIEEPGDDDEAGVEGPPPRVPTPPRDQGYGYRY